MDVHTKDGNMKEYHGSAMLGLTSGNLNFEGPIIKDRTSFTPPSVALGWMPYPHRVWRSTIKFRKRRGRNSAHAMLLPI